VGATAGLRATGARPPRWCTDPGQANWPPMVAGPDEPRGRQRFCPDVVGGRAAALAVSRSTGALEQRYQQPLPETLILKPFCPLEEQERRAGPYADHPWAISWPDATADLQAAGRERPVWGAAAARHVAVRELAGRHGGRRHPRRLAAARNFDQPASLLARTARPTRRRCGPGTRPPPLTYFAGCPPLTPTRRGVDVECDDLSASCSQSGELMW
jgi:hypothetical protein